jgi:phosphate transport system permease protein
MIARTLMPGRLAGSLDDVGRLFSALSGLGWTRNHIVTIADYHRLMKSFPLASGGSRGGRPERFHAWRRRKDSLARWVIALGGVGVIAAVVLIFFYLLYVVFPLLNPARAERIELGRQAAWAEVEASFMAVEEQLQIALLLGADGSARFLSLADGTLVKTVAIIAENSGRLSAAATAQEGTGTVAVALQDGRVATFQHRYATDFAQGIEHRKIVPSIVNPYGLEPRGIGARGAVSGLAVSDADAALVIAAYDGDGIYLEWNDKQENFLTGEVRLATRLGAISPDYTPTGVAISGDQRWLYVSDDTGYLHRYSLPTLEPMQRLQISGQPITALTMLLGGISVLAGDASGTVTQLFPVRADDNDAELTRIRSFGVGDRPVVRIIPEQRRKGFVVIDAAGTLAIYHSTSERLLLQRSLEGGMPAGVALSPRANGLLLLDSRGELGLLQLKNEHPEVSLKSLWRKVWYENYQEPEFVWQSSAATNEFEPKFSLTPLAFGTLKAALYAMLFAVPLALLGAAYTAYFMAPAMRRLVKPTIEIMAALPTVILGFLAGLWFAPFVEDNLAGIFTALLVVPVGLLVFSYLWTWRPATWFPAGIDGWEAAALIPVVVLLLVSAMALAAPIEHLFFGGSLRNWFSQQAGISYDQRNALVVGVAMGFAVIPTIFSIAEDAVFGVPQSLSDGSLALGATRWQTLVRVVLPTASPGIFSGLMIGLGRAVGETMIVLMATGNTPVMDWNIFEGMRTLAANIAVEMPESEVASSHYRILFLAALVLFMFTFVVNTAAELIRQRLREKYSSL